MSLLRLLTRVHVRHSFLAAVLAQSTCRLGFMTPPRLSQEQLQQRILPIALLFAASIALSNLAVSYLTVPFMQMLKVMKSDRVQLHTN